MTPAAWALLATLGAIGAVLVGFAIYSIRNMRH